MTPELSQRALDAVRMGGSLRDAALYAGLNPNAVNDWCTDGRALAPDHPEHPKVIFEQRVAEARNAVKLESLALLRQSARDRVSEQGTSLKGDWKAAAWWLERRYPEEYAVKKEGVNPERAAGLLGVLMDRVLSDPRLELTPAQRACIPEVLHEHLDALSGEARSLEPAG